MSISKLLIADDHSLLRDGLRKMVESTFPGIDVVESCNFRQVIEMVNESPDLDLILLDLGMPDMNGFVAIELLSDQPVSIPVIVISASENPIDMQRALDKGAAGYIPKSESNDVILSAIRLVLAGGVYIPAAMVKSSTPYVGDADSAPHPLPSLTKRQHEVLHCIMQGISNKAIANQLGLSEVTIKSHVTAIFRSLGVNNRTQVVLKAKQLGYPDLQAPLWPPDAEPAE